MSGSFASQLRASKTIRLVPEGQPSITVRVQIPDIWDLRRFEVSPSEPVLTLKRRALDALIPDAELVEDFVMKLKGWEILDEQATLADAGATNGSTFLLTYKRRRPVR